MPACRLLPLCLASLLLGSIHPAFGAERVELTTDTSAAKPAPAWVKMVDLGAKDPALKGYFAPEGVLVEVVATEPQTIDPVGMIFDAAGRMLVLEWREGKGDLFPALDEFELTYQDGSKKKRFRNRKSVRDELKLLEDKDGDGKYESARVLLNDLETPSSILLHDGWLYISGAAHVVRRKVLADDKFGPPEEILRGFCGFNQHQVSGLTIGADGWLYISSGDDDNFVEGSDGSRATTLRCGGVFRCRPNGSQVSVFALGFRNPYRDVVFDDLGNLFHADNDNEDGSKFQGCRLIHLLEGADYGWRLQAGVHCCRPDHALGAVFGEQAGKMPSLAKTGRGAPAGLTIYNGDKFPAFFRGLLLYPDVVQKNVRAYRVERAGSTFAVAEQFELLRSDDPMFRPVQVVVGPDGAIYVVDWRTNSTGPGWFWGDGKHGRIWRLTWNGTSDAPAIARGPLTTWSKLAELSDVDLIANLDAADGQVRSFAERELMRRQTADPNDARRQSLIHVAGDASKPAASRAAALCLAAQTLDRASIELLLATISEAKTEPELARLAIELLGHNGLPAGEINVVCDRLLAALDTLPPPAARSAAIALGDLVSRLPADDARRRKTAEILLQYADSHSSRDDPFLVDAIVRGIERMGAPALAILIKPSLRLDLVRSLRASAAAAALDRALAGELKLSPAQWISLLSVYRNLQADPPADITAIGSWLTKHSDMPAEVQLAALESMAVAGKSNGPAVLPVVLSILKSDNAQTRIAALGVVGSYGLLGAAKPLVALLKETERSDDERRAIVAALGKLRPLQGFGVIESTERGVDGCIADLVAIAADPKAGAVRGDVLALVAQLDFGQGQPLAQQMLSDADTSVAVAAINVLGARADQAETIGRQFVAGKIDRRLLPQVAAVLQNHVAADKSGKFATLLAEVFKGGLLVSTDPAELARVEQLVKTTGDPARGRGVYLSANRSQCVKCHGLEGVGGQIGPDLSKIWQTHTVGKILEAIIEPSKEIKENFQTFVVTTIDGQVHAGLRTSLDDKQVVLRTAEGKDIVIPRGDIDEMAETKRSLMPDGVTAQLSFQEFIDLVAFLKNQAAQESLRTMLTQGWVVVGATGEVEKAAATRIDPLQPLKSAEGKPLTWQRVASDGEGRFDLSAAAGAKPIYLLAFVHSPSAQSSQFSIAADGNWQLLVAGKPIERAASAEPTAAVAANLPAGWTSLLFKISEPPAKCSVKMSVAGGEQLRLAAEPK